MEETTKRHQIEKFYSAVEDLNETWLKWIDCFSEKKEKKEIKSRLLIFQDTIKEATIDTKMREDFTFDRIMEVRKFLEQINELELFSSNFFCEKIYKLYNLILIKYFDYIIKDLRF